MKSIFLLSLLCACGWAHAELGELLAPNAQVEKLAGGFRFTEGPAANSKGDVFFTDIPNNRIHQWSTEGKLSTFRENSGGANGLYFWKDRLLACEGGNRQLTSIAPDGSVTVLAKEYQGKRLNSPNDLWPDKKAGIYFTDPRYGNMDNLELEGFYVFYLKPGHKELIRVIDDLVKPNGVIGTPDNKTLYVADQGGGKTYAYNIEEDGTLSGKRLFASQGSDGMTLDEKGNLYLTGAGLDVYNPDGEKLGVIEIPERPANVTFGGPDHRTLFITARTSLYAIPMRVRGMELWAGK